MEDRQPIIIITKGTAKGVPRSVKEAILDVTDVTDIVRK